MKRSCAVMLRDKINDTLRQTDFFGEFDAVRNVADDDFRALRRFQFVVRIFAELVFDKMFRRGRFADVVVKRTDPC